MKDCTAIRRAMSITYGPECERCGKGPCIMKISSKAVVERHAAAIRRKYGLDERNRPIRRRTGRGL